MKTNQWMANLSETFQLLEFFFFAVTSSMPLVTRRRENRDAYGEPQPSFKFNCRVGWLAGVKAPELRRQSTASPSSERIRSQIGSDSEK